MENVLATISEPKTEAEYVAALDILLAEMRRADEWMEANRREIDRLRTESRVIGEHTDSVLADVTVQLDRLQKAG